MEMSLPTGEVTANPDIKLSHLKHRPLQDPSTNFRLVNLLPAQPDHEIRCTLEEYGLNNVPSYNAVSYEWGNAGTQSQIKVNDKKYRVTSNLFDFLQQLQPADGQPPVPIFVDAICIDQSNIIERNAQVRLMGRIYYSAHTVFVWLGRAGDNSDLLVDFARDEKLKYHGQYPSDFPSNHELVLDHINHYADPSVLWSAMEAVLGREYWRRLWIIQETLLAERIVFYCGRKHLTWDQLSAAVQNLDRWAVRNFDETYGAKSNRYTAVSRLHRFEPFRWKGRWPGSVDESKIPSGEVNAMGAFVWIGGLQLSNLIIEYGSANCADERDRVYGLLGLSNVGSQFPVDYSKNGLYLFFRTLALRKEGMFIGIIKFGCHLQRLLLLQPTISTKEAFNHISACPPNASTQKPFTFEVKLTCIGYISGQDTEKRTATQPPSPPFSFQFVDDDENKEGYASAVARSDSRKCYSTIQAQTGDLIFQFIGTYHAILLRDPDPSSQREVNRSSGPAPYTIIGRAMLLRDPQQTAIADAFLNNDDFAFCTNSQFTVERNYSWRYKPVTLCTQATLLDMLRLTANLDRTEAPYGPLR